MGGSQGKRGWEKGEVGSCNLTRPIIGSKPGLPGLKQSTRRRGRGINPPVPPPALILLRAPGGRADFSKGMLPVKDLSQEYLRELAGRENQLGQVFTRSFPVSPLPQVSCSESGSLGNSSGSDVTSLSSQLPDTPNSMVPSPVET